MGNQKHRERRQRQKTFAAQAREAKQARVSKSAASRWYLTIVRRPTSCARCARALRPAPQPHTGVEPGHQMVFRKDPETHLCVDCANAQGIRYLLSQRFEREYKVGANRRPV